MLGYVIGDADMVTGFALIGVEGVEVTSPKEANQALEKALERGGLAIIIVSEEFSTHPQTLHVVHFTRRRNVEVRGAPRCDVHKALLPCADLLPQRVSQVWITAIEVTAAALAMVNHYARQFLWVLYRQRAQPHRV